MMIENTRIIESRGANSRGLRLKKHAAILRAVDERRDGGIHRTEGLGEQRRAHGAGRLRPHCAGTGSSASAAAENSRGRRNRAKIEYLSDVVFPSPDADRVADHPFGVGRRKPAGRQIRR